MKTLSLAFLCTVATTLAAPIQAQCPGQGNLVFELVSVDNSGTAASSQVTLRILGAPNEIICLTCDTSTEANTLPGFGTLCIDLASPDFLELVFSLPPTGVLETVITVPDNLLGSLLCCQTLGLDLNSPSLLEVSNAICVGQENCVGGGVGAIGVITEITDVTVPTTVTAGIVGSSGGGGNAEASVDYDPSNPPTFPVVGNAGVVIENIARIGDSLFVTSRIMANPGMQHQSHGNRLPNNMSFTVSADGKTNAQTIHTSCSQPLGVGMVFGEFTVTELKFP